MIATLAAAALSACQADAKPSTSPGRSPAGSPAASQSSTPVTSPPSTSPTPAATAPHVVRHAVTRAPSFRWSSRPVTASELGKSWHPGCPVGPSSLRAVQVSFWGFDAAAHTGTVVVNVNAVSAVVAAMRTIYLARFPIRQLVPIAAYGGDDNRSMAADNTSAFNCRYAVADGPKQWSMHAYGEAIDFNPVENPYTLDGRVYPPNGKPYTNRSRTRAGMVVSSSAPVRAFSAVGWGWGGRWSSSPDYQHFSSNGK